MKFCKLYIKCLLVVIFLNIPLSGKSFIVVLDAGHGGHDAGAIGTYSKEKNINLNVTLKVGELIQKNRPDIKVIYTRKTDVFVDLDERAAIANRAKADLFISIHTNALPKGRQAVGAETYSLGMARSSDNLDVAKRENSVILFENNYQKRYAGFNPKSSESYIIFEFMQDQHMKQSAQLAKSIQSQYVKCGRPDKGVKQAGFLVLRGTSMPSVLTELGFISTPSEEQYLNSSKGTDELARAIYMGFVDYLESYAKSKSVVLSNAGQSEHNVTDVEKKQTIDTTVVNENAPQKVQLSNVEKADLTDSVQNVTNDAKQLTSEPAQGKPHTAGVSEQKTDMNTVSYKLQILISDKLLKTDNKLFKNIDASRISYYTENKMYKYTFGSTKSYKEIIELKKSLKDKFPDCFVIAMKGTEKISIQEAQNILSKMK